MKAEAMHTATMPSSIVGSVIKLIRLKQWVKNLFLLAPLLFARELFMVDKVVESLRAFVIFSLVASTIYIINDIVDAPSDRLHPKKRFRPIAAGDISSLQAAWLAGTLILAAGLASIGMSGKFLMAVGIYAAINVAYSFKFKEVVLLDVFCIAAGFMLRILAGAFAISVEISSWLVLCSLFISLFLGFGKRRAELVQVQTGIGTGRKVLQAYRLGFLDQMLGISAAGAVISYALYTVAPRTVAIFGTEKLIYTTVLVCFGVFRYLLIASGGSETEDPTNAVTSDPQVLATGIIWVIACGIIIYAGG